MLLFVTLRIKALLGRLEIMGVMQSALVVWHDVFTHATASTRRDHHVIHNNPVGLVLLLELTTNFVIFLSGHRLPFLPSSTIFGTWCHDIEVLIHRRVQLTVYALTTQNLHILHAAS